MHTWTCGLCWNWWKASSIALLPPTSELLGIDVTSKGAGSIQSLFVTWLITWYSISSTSISSTEAEVFSEPEAAGEVVRGDSTEVGVLPVISPLQGMHNTFKTRFTIWPRVMTMKLWGPVKLIQRLYCWKLVWNFMWSQAFKCSVKTCTTRLSTECYFIIIWVT